MKIFNRRNAVLGALGAAGLAAVGLAGCKASSQSEGSADDEEVVIEDEDYEEVVELEEEIADADYAVTMITDVGGVNDQSFNQLAWEGLQELQEQTGVAVSYFESADESEYADSIGLAVAMGNNLVWGVGYATAEAIEDAAAENSNVSFAVIDNEFEDPASNLTGVTFRAQEACFVVGYIAARCSSAGKLGFVGGEESDAVRAFEYGFRAGADYAAAVAGASAEVSAVYLESFDDEDAGKEAAAELYAGGCDVVFHAAGNAGNGVIEAAEEADALVIGVDDDQYDLAPEHVLSSALKRVDEAILEVSLQAANGEAIGGTNIELGMTESALGISEHHDLMADEVYEAALELIEAIKDGDIEPPMDNATYQEFVAAL